uniref:FMN-dependent dehydrogenase domain-containing protein n=1 Tax=Oryza rufipogon TaxID=4529 RepID=A0A0E0QB92_ORYRU
MEDNLPLNIYEHHEIAKKALPKVIYDYINSGAEDEHTLRTCSINPTKKGIEGYWRRIPSFMGMKRTRPKGEYCIIWKNKFMTSRSCGCQQGRHVNNLTGIQHAFTHNCRSNVEPQISTSRMGEGYS